MAGNFNIGEIFSEYKNKVYRLALSISRNEKDAEDITQNTFFKIIKNLRHFENRSSLSTWIYKISYNEALMHLRKKISRYKLSSSLKLSRDKGTSGLFVNWAKLPDEQLLADELKERIDNAIRQMPIQYRMALLLNEVEGLALKDSAKILKLKMNSLKTRLHRARLFIKSDISGYFRDQEDGQGEKKQRRCGIWTGFVYNYAHGNLGKRKSKAFRRHIKDCFSCNSFLNTYLKAIDITQSLECQDLPDELKKRIENFLLKKEIKNNEPFLPLEHLKYKKEGGDMLKRITRDELTNMVSSGQKLKLVDVLDKEHYEKEHIPGAISLPLNEIEKKAEKVLKKDEMIVVYCASFDCQASTSATEKLLSLGYKNVLDYKGGLKDYKAANLPLEGSLHKASSGFASSCSTC